MEVTFWNIHHGSYLVEGTPWKLPHGNYNVANRTGTDRDIKNYKSQRNLVVKMNRQAEKEFYANLDPTEIGNSKKFW